MRTITLLCALSLLVPYATSAQETQIASDVRREKEHVVEACNEFTVKALGGCAYTLFTSSPFHIAVGSLAPQNGFSFGLAFAERFTPNESWRLSWNADAVTTATGSWRAGAYMKLIRTPSTSGVSVRPAGAPPAAPVAIGPREFPVIDLVVQTISLKTISFYGLGQDSLRQNRSTFGERQTIIGASTIYPLAFTALAPLHPALIGGLHLRFIDVRPGRSSDFPSVEQRFDENSAQGLTKQDAFVEFTEGIRFSPSVANGWLHFNYLLSAQQFRTSEDAHGSFARWTADLQHEIPLYRRTTSTGPRDFNGPNECNTAATSTECPPVQWSRNREGTVSFRFLLTGTNTGSGDRVPFFLQPTLGGSDLNGQRLLAGYDDYRFRGPDLLAFQEGIEHSVWGPIGVFFQAEQGKVASQLSDLGFTHLAPSATVGVTLRAGGFPLVNFSFAWGGEGHHWIGSMNSSLLGGSIRPSLY